MMPVFSSLPVGDSPYSGAYGHKGEPKTGWVISLKNLLLFKR